MTFADGYPCTSLADALVGGLHQVPLYSGPPQLLRNGMFCEGCRLSGQVGCRAV